MPTTSSSVQFICEPGVKRDGTISEGQNWIDSQHTRFYRSLPKSMGGYRTITQGFDEIIRGATYIYSRDNFNTIYGGSATQLYISPFNGAGFGSGVEVRTPAALIADVNNIWQISAMDYNPGGFNAIVAHAAPNMDIASSTETAVFYGDISAVTALIPVTDAADPTNVALLQAAVTGGGSVTINGDSSDSSIISDAICLSQAIAGAGNAVINGSFASVGTATLDVPRQVTIVSSNAGNTTQTATITGTNQTGGADSEVLTFKGTTTVLSTKIFSTVTQVAISAAITGTFKVGVNGYTLFDAPRQITIVSTNAGDTTQTATLKGYDANGTYQTEVLTFTGTTRVTGTLFFEEVTGVVISATMTGQLTVGTAGITLKVSGGILGLYPFLFAFGNDGRIKWSIPGDLTNFTDTVAGAGSTRISAQKVIAAVPDRASGTSQPAALFFALDKVVRANFTSVSSGQVFAFSDVPGYAGLLSSSAIVEYDGIYYWPANGRFQSYNGVIRELPNNMNLLWFYQNININHRQKIWGMAMPQWGEIWWFAPMFGATECNYVLIFNVREGSWYSTQLSRSAGLTSTIFTYPTMFGNELNINNNYSLWQHEYGVDEDNGSQLLAIPKYIKSAEISLCAPNSVGLPSNQDTAVQIDRLELDLNQTGNMTIEYTGRDYPRATPLVWTGTFTPNQGTVDKAFESRQVNIKMTSNIQGGSFEFGRNTLYIQTSQGDDNYAGTGG